jgi:hypothetical protein
MSCTYHGVIFEGVRNEIGLILFEQSKILGLLLCDVQAKSFV